MRILIPLLDKKGEDSSVSLYFGHAPYFAIFDTESKKLEIVKNELDHSNLDLTPVDQLMKYKLDVVYVKDIGQRAINLFQEKGIKLKTGNWKIVKEVLEHLEELVELKRSCGH